MKPLNVREWLERERLSGLPHADFAADALLALDERDGLADDESNLLDAINQATGDVVDSSDQIVEAFRVREAVLTALSDAGVSDGEDLTAAQVGGLLRMFLPV